MNLTSNGFSQLLILLLVSSLVLSACTKQEKIGFVQNAKLFQDFKGTIELEEKLAKKRKRNLSQLDSLRHLIEIGRDDLRDIFTQKEGQFSQQETLLSDQYTAEIWNYINAGIKDYGEMEGYDYILGASGEGSLMYAKESKNITDDVLSFINKRFQGKNQYGPLAKDSIVF